MHVSCQFRKRLCLSGHYFFQHLVSNGNAQMISRKGEKSQFVLKNVSHTQTHHDAQSCVKKWGKYDRTAVNHIRKAEISHVEYANSNYCFCKQF